MKEYFKIKSLVRSQVPEFVNEQHPLFVDFVVAYYEWLSQNEGIFVKSLQENDPQKFIDVDETIEDFLDSFSKTYLHEFPIRLIFDEKNGKKLDVRKAVKNIKKFYNAKGTEKSYRFLFRILYDSEIEIYYPQKDVLVPSGGKWIQRSFMRMEKIKEINEYELTGNYIFQKENTKDPYSKFKGRARVNRVKKITANGLEIIELEIENLEGSFQTGEHIYAEINNTTKRYGIVAPILRSIVITNPGENYERGDLVKFSLINRESYRGIPPKAYVSRTVSFKDRRGIIKEILIEDPGFNSNLYQMDFITGFVQNSANFFGPGDGGCVGCPPPGPPGGGEGGGEEGGGEEGGGGGEEGGGGISLSETSFTGYRVNSAIYTERGFYVDGGEQLSSNKYIQDNDYYQNYSYVIKSNMVLDEYKEIIKKLIHPSGTKLFGETIFKDCFKSEPTHFLTTKQKNIKNINGYTGNGFTSSNLGITSSVSNPIYAYIHPDQLTDFYGRSVAGTGQSNTGWQEWVYSDTNLGLTAEQIRFFEKLDASNEPRFAGLVYDNSTPFYKITIEAFLNDVVCGYDCRLGDECA